MVGDAVSKKDDVDDKNDENNDSDDVEEAVLAVNVPDDANDEG